MDLARFLVVFVALVTLSACGKQEMAPQSTKVKIDFGSLALSSGAGGVVIIDQFAGGQTTYVLSTAASSEVFDLAVGSHTFHAFAWSGPNPLEGTVYCGSQSVVLEDSSVTPLQSVSVSASPAGCSNYSNGVDTTYGIDSLEFIGCSSTDGITSYSDSCAYPATKWGSSNSYKLTVTGANGRNLTSGCVADNGQSSDSSLGDRVVNSSLRIPTGGTLGIVPTMSLVGYDRLDCTVGDDSAKTLSIAASLEGNQGLTVLTNSAGANKLFWGQNEFGVQSQMLSDYLPAFHCSTPVAGTPAPIPCFQDYNLSVNRDSDDADLYYQRIGTSSTYTFYSNETTTTWGYHLTKGTPNAVGAPAYCTVSASTGYANTPTCTCGPTAGDSNPGSSTQGCNLAIFNDNAADKFTGHPVATPKSVTLTLINASPAPTSATYALDVYVSDALFEGIAYAVESNINLFGSNYGKYTYYQAGTDAAYQLSNDGDVNDLLAEIGEGGISGALTLLGYSACTDSVVTGSFASEVDGSPATVTLSSLTASETSLLFPMSTPVAFDRKYRMTFSTSGTTEQITWLFKCAGATSPNNEKQVGEIWSSYDFGAGEIGVEHLVYDHSSASKYAQYSEAGAWGTREYYNFSQIKNFGSSGLEVKTIKIDYSSATPSGYKVAALKGDASPCTYVAYAEDYHSTSAIEDSTNISFAAGFSTPTATTVQANASGNYDTCTATAPSSMIAPALLWAAATPLATPYINPYFVGKKLFDSTCSGAGTARSSLECAIYNRMGVTPALSPVRDDDYLPIQAFISGQAKKHPREGLNKLKRQWALEMGSCVELSQSRMCL